MQGSSLRRSLSDDLLLVLCICHVAGNTGYHHFLEHFLYILLLRKNGSIRCAIRWCRNQDICSETKPLMRLRFFDADF